MWDGGVYSVLSVSYRVVTLLLSYRSCSDFIVFYRAPNVHRNTPLVHTNTCRSILLVCSCAPTPHITLIVTHISLAFPSSLYHNHNTIIYIISVAAVWWWRWVHVFAFLLHRINGDYCTSTEPLSLSYGLIKFKWHIPVRVFFTILCPCRCELMPFD